VKAPNKAPPTKTPANRAPATKKPVSTSVAKLAGKVIYDVDNGVFKAKVVETVTAQSKAKGTKIWTITKTIHGKVETYSVEVSQRQQYNPNKPIYVYKSSVKTIEGENQNPFNQGGMLIADGLSGVVDFIGQGLNYINFGNVRNLGQGLINTSKKVRKAAKDDGYNPDGIAAQITGGSINAASILGGGWVASGIVKGVAVLPKVAGAIGVVGQVASKLPFAGKAVQVATHPTFHKGVVVVGAAANVGFTYHAASTGDFKTATTGVLLGGAGVAVAGKVLPVLQKTPKYIRVADQKIHTLTNEIELGIKELKQGIKDNHRGGGNLDAGKKLDTLLLKIKALKKLKVDTTIFSTTIEK
jgi:hypothetical protein